MPLPRELVLLQIYVFTIAQIPALSPQLSVTLLHGLDICVYTVADSLLVEINKYGSMASTV